jgi:hypothetical protein
MKPLANTFVAALLIAGASPPLAAAASLNWICNAPRDQFRPLYNGTSEASTYVVSGKVQLLNTTVGSYSTSANIFIERPDKKDGVIFRVAASSDGIGDQVFLLLDVTRSTVMKRQALKTLPLRKPIKFRLSVEASGAVTLDVNGSRYAATGAPMREAIMEANCAAGVAKYDDLQFEPDNNPKIPQ